MVTRAVMSPNISSMATPLVGHATPITSLPETSKVAPQQSGLPSPAESSGHVTTEMQHPPLTPAAPLMQPVGTAMGQNQGLAVVGNFVPTLHSQQVSLGMAVVSHPGVPASTGGVVVQSQMIPDSSVAHHQPAMVPSMAQMPVIVSVQPGISDGLQQAPGNVAQMAGAAPFVQVHSVPITTLPVPPPLQPITCSDFTLPTPQQPLPVASPGIQRSPGPSLPVAIPSSTVISARNDVTPAQVEPRSPIYEVKLEASVKDVVIERTFSSTCLASSAEKTKAQSKSDGTQVENGDETAIAENITVVTQTDNKRSSTRAVKPSDDDDDRRGNVKTPTKNKGDSNSAHSEQNVSQSNGES